MNPMKVLWGSVEYTWIDSVWTDGQYRGLGSVKAILIGVDGRVHDVGIGAIEAIDPLESKAGKLGFQRAIDMLRSEEFTSACENGPDPADWLEARK